MLQTKYITIDEVEQYFPELAFKKAMETEEEAIAFIKRIEDRLAVYIDSNFNRNINNEYPNFTDYQKEHYKLALLEQVVYIFRNGDLSVDSGFDQEKGVVAGDIKDKFIAPNTIDHLRVCGIWNRNLRHHRSYIGWL